VKMIRHQGKGKHSNRVTLSRGKEGLVVLILMKDNRATISPIDHMINETGLLTSWDSRHEQALSYRHVQSQRKSSLSPFNVVTSRATFSIVTRYGRSVTLDP
jgi:hypothetical protein